MEQLSWKHLSWRQLSWRQLSWKQSLVIYLRLADSRLAVETQRPAHGCR